MKKIKLITLSLLLVLFIALNAHAQDSTKTTPGVSVKVLFENENVKVIEATFPPGATTDWHSHPNHVAYALTDGKLEITEKDKPAIVAEMKAGNASYSTAVTHKVKNIGTATVKMVNRIE